MANDPDEVAKFYAIVFSTPEGQQVLDDLAGRLNANRQVFTANPVLNAFQQGRQAVFYEIEERIAQGVNPDGQAQPAANWLAARRRREARKRPAAEHPAPGNDATAR